MSFALFRYAIVECHSLPEAENIISESKDLKLKDNVLSIDLISHTSKDDGKLKLPFALTIQGGKEKEVPI